jgi:nicotinamidase-related amidase
MSLNITARRNEAYRPGETAILFVDMQKIFCTPGSDPQHPELNAKHYYHRQLESTVIPNQSRLI